MQYPNVKCKLFNYLLDFCFQYDGAYMLDK